MRKILAVALLAVALGGCGVDLKTIGTAFTLGTASVQNPITPAREAQIEAAIDAGVQAMLVYRRACIAGNADVNCKRNIELVQPYTRQLKALVVKLRLFVDQNDQVNAVVIFKQIVPLYESVKDIAGTAGISIGALP